MAVPGVYVEDLVVGSHVRRERQVWRVAEVSRYEPGRVDLLFVRDDNGETLALIMRAGHILELMSPPPSPRA